MKMAYAFWKSNLCKLKSMQISNLSKGISNKVSLVHMRYPPQESLNKATLMRSNMSFLILESFLKNYSQSLILFNKNNLRSNKNNNLQIFKSY